MKVVILAGGYGSRLSEETEARPKPLVEIGGKPILWHIMKIYSSQGYNDFVVCAGYKGHQVKEFFANYRLYESDITVDFNEKNISYHSLAQEKWKVSVIDTGLNVMTGSRLKRVQKYLNDEPFMLTYGDGVANVNIEKLIESHNNSNKIATLTAVKPPARFGSLDIAVGGEIVSFREKIQGDESWINGGFFVMNPAVFSYIPTDDDTILESDVLTVLAKESQLNSYKHDNFWKCMDTLRDKKDLDRLWETSAPWKLWD